MGHDQPTPRRFLWNQRIWGVELCGDVRHDAPTDNALFSQALGLTAPRRASEVDFRPQEAAIHFQVVCDAQRLPCPACGASDQPIRDRIARTWQHLHFFQFRAHIHAELPRVACSVCGKTSQIEVPKSRKGSGFSLTKEAFIMALCRETTNGSPQGMPALAVARLLGVPDGRVWCVLGHYVQQARAKADYSAARRIAMDERSARRGHLGSQWYPVWLFGLHPFSWHRPDLIPESDFVPQHATYLARARAS